MNVLFIAPLPPPVTGHALVSQALLDDLQKANEVTTVNLSTGSSHDGRVTGRRIAEVGRLIVNIWRAQRAADVIYLTISESIAGNMKDVLIYAVCWPRLSRMFVHLHGGSLRKLLFDRSRLLERINRAFIARLAGVIVSGSSHIHIFDQLTTKGRIHVVPNFAADEVFVTEQLTVDKFAEVLPLRILYLSAMSEAKGYQFLADAYEALRPDVQSKLRLDFAGRFESQAEEQRFKRQIAGWQHVRYHGFVDDARKKSLLAAAHVLCLPTTMFEGQPIAILEAYASGCVVLTTGQEGIRDIFENGLNGFEFEAGSKAALGAALARIADETQSLLPIALRNRRTAESRYRVASYTDTLSTIFASAVASERPFEQ